MREIDAREIGDSVARLCIEANISLPDDLRCRLDEFSGRETWDTAREVLDRIRENYELAERKRVPICQDTGMAVVFIELGQEVHVRGSLRDAVNDGVRRGYEDGYLRKSVVRDPLRRDNTGDNTPAVLYTELVDGESVKITVAPKGFGSENMSRIAMLAPAEGIDGVRDFVVRTIESAGSNPCPPVVVGVGIGSTFEGVAMLAKRALLRDLRETNPDPFYAELELELLEKINALGVGPQGYGGLTTALGVSILAAPTHIAGLPCAVNVGCHVTRHMTEVL